MGSSAAAEQLEIEIDRDVQAELLDIARNDFLGFVLFNKSDYRVNWHHRFLANKLERFAKGETRYLMVFMPPRHGKSELVSRMLPAYLHGLYPDCEIMAASYSDSLAGDMCIDVQKIIDSKEYKNVFPDTRIFPSGTAYSKGTRNSEEHHIVGRRGKYRGQGVGGSFTGKGANFIIIDDPIKGREVADSVAFRERLWEFYNNDLFSRLETDLTTGRVGQILITQTRWHEDDLSGRLLDLMRKDTNAAQFEIIEFPAIRITKDNQDDPREIGAALWEEKYSVGELQKYKTDPRAWSSLYQQNPVPDGGGLFRDHMFRFVDMPGQFDWMFITADTAYKEKQENDFNVFSSWGVIGDQLYLYDVWMEQCRAVDVEDKVRPFIKRFENYGFRSTWIEPKGHGIYLNDKFRREGRVIPSEEEIKEFFNDRRLDKVERANNVVPHLSNRFIGINKDIANKEDLVAQCLGFPKVKHDDFVDTVIDALKKKYNVVVGILDVL